MPRRICFSVRVANQRSTWLSQDAEVGVKWTWKRGWRANQSRTARRLVRAIIVHDQMDAQVVGRDASMVRRNFKNSVLLWRRCMFANDDTGGDIQGGEQGRRAMAL